MRTHAVRPIEILLVEDAPTDVVVVKEMLAAAKVINNLRVVDSGEQALEYLQQRGPFGRAATPDLILMRWQLPRLSGQQLLSAIRADERCQRVPVAVLAVRDDAAEVARAQALQANWFVVKPLEFSALAEMVRASAQWWLCIVSVPEALTQAADDHHGDDKQPDGHTDVHGASACSERLN